MLERGHTLESKFARNLGLKCGKAAFDITGSKFVTAVFSTVGGKEDLANTSADATPMSLAHTPFETGIASAGSITLSGGGIATVTQARFSYDNQTQADEPAIGSGGVAAGVTHGKCMVTGTLKILLNTAEYALYEASKSLAATDHRGLPWQRARLLGPREHHLQLPHGAHQAEERAGGYP
jgi:hypothetical protein